MTKAIAADMQRQRKPGHSTLAFGTLRQFRIIFGSVRLQFREVEESCGITGSQLWILHELSKDPGIGVSELANRLSIHQTTCSQQVEALASKGLLTKARSKADRRKLGLSISAQAKRLLLKAPGPAEGLLPDALLALAGDDLKSLNRQLEKVIARLPTKNMKYGKEPLAHL